MVGLAGISAIRLLLLVMMHRAATVSFIQARLGETKHTGTAVGDRTAGVGDNPSHPSKADNKTLKTQSQVQGDVRIRRGGWVWMWRRSDPQANQIGSTEAAKP